MSNRTLLSTFMIIIFPLASSLCFARKFITLSSSAAPSLSFMCWKVWEVENTPADLKVPFME